MHIADKIALPAENQDVERTMELCAEEQVIPPLMTLQRIKQIFSPNADLYLFYRRIKK
jgi:hypothetical protein